MRINLRRTATGCFAIASLLTSPLISSEISAMPARDAFTITSSTKAPLIDTQARPVNLEKTPVLVKNTPVKPEPAGATSAAKEKKVEDKKTIGRCWKRLMNMAREIRNAHTNTSK
ncbi:hypothetical protein [Spirosoma radiotolerans]|uniref:hypothetical protein n=1 Tax=Spirosoma radiotolerans TaxID=1379870 RepID=UPI000695AA78|nr:hypothetical protein [Spirosoma radiotolerans]